MKPSDRWRRQGYSTYQHERSVAAMVPLIGEDNIMWGSDYPHPDGIWPDSQKWIAEDLAGSARPSSARFSATTPARSTGCSSAERERDGSWTAG